MISALDKTAVLCPQRDLSESAKDNIRSRIASTVQSASIPENNLTKDERQALKRLRKDNNIVTLLADKGGVTVVMDKADYSDEMDTVNDKQTYDEPTPALQHKLNSKISTLKKTDAIDTQRNYRLRCSVPQLKKLYGLYLNCTKWYTNATYSVILWVPYVLTVSVPDDHTATPY